MALSSFAEPICAGSPASCMTPRFGWLAPACTEVGRICALRPQIFTCEVAHLPSMGRGSHRYDHIPEAKLAREAEMSYATLAFVTDYDCWHETEAAVSVETIVHSCSRTRSWPSASTVRPLHIFPSSVEALIVMHCEAIITNPSVIPTHIKAKPGAADRQVYPGG